MQTIEANGLTFNYRDAGDGDPVILLHGFPETSAMWTGLMDALASEGYHAFAYDQRGYSAGARPPEVDAYRYENLGSDVFAVAKAAGFDRFHLIGHDWGAGAGWCALAIDESPVASWTAMSVGHYRPFAEAVRDDPEEEEYRGFLNNIDLLPELFTANDAAALRGIWPNVAPDIVEQHVAVLGDPKAVDAALNWYRACRLHMRCLDDDSFVFGQVSTPTLLVWGKNDRYIRTASIDGAAQWHTGPYRRVDVDATHWLIEEKPDEVRDEILRHLKENPL